MSAAHPAIFRCNALRLLTPYELNLSQRRKDAKVFLGELSGFARVMIEILFIVQECWPLNNS